MGQLVQVFIGSALVPYCARYTARYCNAQKVAAEEAAEAAAAAALEGGALPDGGGDSGKLGLAAAGGAAAAEQVRASTDTLARPTAADSYRAVPGREQIEVAKLSSGVSSSRSAQSLASEGGASDAGKAHEA